jgi:hypothetical protein
MQWYGSNIFCEKQGCVMFQYLLICMQNTEIKSSVMYLLCVVNKVST